MVEAPAQQKYGIQGRPLIAVPEIFQLSNDALGKDAVRLMNERYAGNNHVVLDISGLAENQPIGYSNPYRRFALGPIVRELVGNDVQLLTPALSELALKHGTLPDVRNTYDGLTYEDLAVVVYSAIGAYARLPQHLPGEPVYSIQRANAQLAQHLVDQAKERGIEIKFPLVIYGLETVKDDRFLSGLSFDLGDAAVAYHVPILSRKTGMFNSADPELAKTGFPSKLGSGSSTLYTTNDGLRSVYHYNWRELNRPLRGNEPNRTLYTANQGLCRVIRNMDRDIIANYVDLPNSWEAGRVSFVRGAAPQNLEASIKAIEAEKIRQE